MELLSIALGPLYPTARLQQRGCILGSGNPTGLVWEGEDEAANVDEVEGCVEMGREWHADVVDIERYVGWNRGGFWKLRWADVEAVDLVGWMCIGNGNGPGPCVEVSSRRLDLIVTTVVCPCALRRMLWRFC